MSWPNPEEIVFFAFPLWWILFPMSAVRFYRWFHRLAGMDQRRLDAMTPRKFRISAAIFLAMMIVIGLIGKRWGW